WPETADALNLYLGQRGAASPDARRIFLNAQGLPLTRFGIRWIVRKHAAKARLSCPSLRRKKVSPHTLRPMPGSGLCRMKQDRCLQNLPTSELALFSCSCRPA
ncbi:MAG: hypothetical protein V3T83_05645, partial [Acidobacteriota bacterium]